MLANPLIFVVLQGLMGHAGVHRDELKELCMFIHPMMMYSWYIDNNHPLISGFSLTGRIQIFQY